MDKNAEKIPLGKNKIIKKTLTATLFWSILVLVLYGLPSLYFSQLRKVKGFESLDQSLTLFGFATPVIILLFLVVGFFYYKRKYASFYYSIDEDSVNTKGASIDYKQIQDVAVYQDILDKALDLNNVFVASGNQSIHLDGINPQVTQSLIHKILGNMGNTITEKNPIGSKWVFRIIILLLMILPIALVLQITGLVNYLSFSNYEYYAREDHKLNTGIFLGTIGVIILFGILSSILKRKYLQYAFGDKFFMVKEGVISLHERYISYSAITDVQIKRGLLDTIFNISSLVIRYKIRDYAAEEEYKASGHVLPRRETAQDIGIEGNRIVIPGLSDKDVQSLKENILQRAKKD